MTKPVTPRRVPTRVLETALSTHWAMEEQALRTLLEICARENLETPEMLAARLGRPLDNTNAVEIRDGIATIPVVGPMVRYASIFTQISGATSYDALATDFTRALEDRTVRGIILSIDSHGGDANGISQLAAMVAAAEGIKPVVAFIGGTGASAAYWLASAADAVIVSDTAIVGSIGVRSSYRDTSAVDQARGIKTITLVSSQSPNKRMDPTEDSGRAALQQVMDDLAQVFIDSVAENRGVDPETVQSDFGQGGVFVGQTAVDAGLADAVGTYESTFAALRDRGSDAVATWRDGASAVSAASAPSPREMTMKTESETPAAAAVSAAATAAVTEAPKAAVAETIDLNAVRAAERTRITQIRTLGKGAEAKLVEKCIEDGISADAASRLFLEAQQQSAAAQLERLRADEKVTPAPVPGASTGTELTPRQAAKAATAQFYALSAPRTPKTV